MWLGAHRTHRAEAINLKKKVIFKEVLSPF